MDDEAYLDRAVELAREAVDAGDQPFGALAVLDGDVVATGRNRGHTDGDRTAHAELAVARRVARERPPAERGRCTLYSSAEPCAMCAGAIYWSGIGRVVYCVDGDTLADIAGGHELDVGCREVLERGRRDVEVVGPVNESAGTPVHEDYW